MPFKLIEIFSINVEVPERNVYVGAISLLSTNQNVLETLQRCLHSIWKEQCNDLRMYQSCNIHITQDVQPFLENQQTDDKLLVDFIVILIDASVVTSLQETEINLKSLHRTFGRQRICLVAYGVDYRSNIKPADVWAFSKAFQIALLFGKVDREDNCRHLSEMILNVCEVNCGLTNGVPAIRKF